MTVIWVTMTAIQVTKTMTSRKAEWLQKEIEKKKSNTVRDSDLSDDDSESSDNEGGKAEGRVTARGSRRKKSNKVRYSDSSDDNESSHETVDKTGDRLKTARGKKIKKFNTVRDSDLSNDDSDSSDNELGGKAEDRLKTARGKKINLSNTVYGIDSSDDEDSIMTVNRNKADSKPRENAVTAASCKRIPMRVKWSHQELNILKRHLKSDKPPDEESIRRVMDKFPFMKQRSVPQMKSRALHLIKTGR